MSVYSTPTTNTCFDDGSSPCSNQSFYFTPRETYSYFTPQTRSKKRATPYKGKVPKFNVYSEEVSKSEENLTQENGPVGVSSPIPIPDSNERVCQNAHSAKETIISFDKENIGVRLCSTPSLPFKENLDGYTPLRNISNQLNENKATVFEARISSVGKRFDLRIRTEAGVDLPTKCSVTENSPNFTPITSNEKALINSVEKDTNRVDRSNGSLFRGFKIGRKVRRKSLKSDSRTSTMIGNPIQTNGENINVEYFDKDVENTDIPRVQDEPLKMECRIVNPRKHLSDNSQTPLLVDKKTPPKKIRFWQFIRIRKLRLSPVKRLLCKPSKYLTSFKEKVVKRFSYQPIKPLPHAKSEEVSCVSTDVISTQTHQICALCLENVCNKEEMMSTALSALMTKLSSMEDELKEIKGLVKNNAGAASTLSHFRNAGLPPLPPPPPPPPPPPNFLNAPESTGTLKRKADLTTPENVNHAVKRPAIKNERTQFSITVEDIRSVKLRKTPAHVFKPREPKESNTVNGDEAIRSSRMKKNRVGAVNGKKRTQSLAELNSRENVSITRDPINDLSDLFTPHQNEDLSTMCILEETPVTSKKISVNNRSQKRKEWLIESPVRKRINTGNSSHIYRNATPE